MKFVEDLRIKVNISKTKMGEKLGRSPQAYKSLLIAKEQLTTEDITMLRRHFNLSDTELLDLIEAEFEAYRLEKAIKRAGKKSKPTT
jgi:hypothetical protein